MTHVSLGHLPLHSHHISDITQSELQENLTAVLSRQECLYTTRFSY